MCPGRVVWALFSEPYLQPLGHLSVAVWFGARRRKRPMEATDGGEKR